MTDPNHADEFRRLYLGEFAGQSEDEILLWRMAEEYHRRCDYHDNARGIGRIPLDEYQRQVTNRNAKEVWGDIYNRLPDRLKGRLQRAVFLAARSGDRQSE